MPAVGLDIGHKRIGLAVADAMGWTAQPAGTHDCTGPWSQTCAALKQKLTALNATVLVVGLPLLPSGDEGEQAAVTRRRAQDLTEKTGLPLIFIDERLTSKMAQRVLIEGGVSRQKRKGKIDTLAAALILQTHLDRMARSSP